MNIYQESLKQQIDEADVELNKHDELVEDARGELKQTESRKAQEIEDKDNEIQECQIKLNLQRKEMSRLYEIAQLSYEDERSKCMKLNDQMLIELKKA